MSHRRDCWPRLHHALRHPSCGSARERYGSVRNAREANNFAAANILAKDRTAATSSPDSYWGLRCRTADYSNRPNRVAAARKTAGFARCWSGDSLCNPTRCCADWTPLEADPSALRSNRIPPEHDHDRSCFPVLPSCGYFQRSAAATTVHCQAHSLLRRTDG